MFLSRQTITENNQCYVRLVSAPCSSYTSLRVLHRQLLPSLWHGFLPMHGGYRLHDLLSYGCFDLRCSFLNHPQSAQGLYFASA